MAEVRVRDVEKSFGQTLVLSRVSVTVPDGGFAVLVGPSGCGKSTLLRLLAGLEQCDAGSIHFGDRDVTELPPRERDIAMVFQSYALYPHLTVRRNLAFGLELKKVPGDEIAKRISEVSEMLGLSPLLDRLPRALSGGQRQRVAMGRAIVRRPSLFLFDEPLSNLDAALRAQVRVEIRKLHDRLGATSVYVTHDQVEAMTLADEIFVMHGGVVEQSGRPLAVYEDPATRFVASFLGSPSMNFIDGRVVEAGGTWRALAAGVDLPLLCRPKNVSTEQAVVIGVRPHDVRFAPHDGSSESARAAGHVYGRIDVVEALGTETFAHLAVSEAPFVARLEPGSDARAGDTVRLAVDAGRVHVFDPETGVAI